MDERVLSIFGPREEVSLFVLFSAAIGSEVTSNFLIQPLHLTGRFVVVPRGEADVDVQLLTECLPYF